MIISKFSLIALMEAMNNNMEAMNNTIMALSMLSNPKNFSAF